MLNEERINQAKNNMKRYLDDGLIWKTASYKESIEVAKKLYDENISNL